MLVTDDEALAQRARHLSTQARLPGRAYDHDEVGYNYRLSNLAAALGVAQLEELPALVAARRALARATTPRSAHPGLRPRAACDLGGPQLLAVHDDRRSAPRPAASSRMTSSTRWPPQVSTPARSGPRSIGLALYRTRPPRW